MKEKINKAWTMYTIENSWVTQYNIFTKAWNYRGGKVYHVDKYALVISWLCHLIIDEGWTDKKQVLTPESWIITIPSWTPNIFYYPEDCLMLEWFPSASIIKKFERYTIMKNS